ncbi:MAG TPA: hypothetical protein DDX16_06540, partial [Candidatus Omnitrophica bacterium]|nr:hypothetical protein [Candidatus Omnitrophota bacterium]
MTMLVFDSGHGGVMINRKLSQCGLNIKLIGYFDRKNMPYGEKSKEEIECFTRAAIEYLNESDKANKNMCMIIACNTAAVTVDFGALKKQYPHIHFIEPVKNTLKRIRALPEGSRIGVIGTRGTERSGVYQKLGYVLATPLLAVLVEMLDRARYSANEQQQSELNNIAKDIVRVDLREFIERNEISHLVLACTHYHYLIKIIEEEFPQLRERIISTRDSVIDEVREFLKCRLVGPGELEARVVGTVREGKDMDRIIQEAIIRSSLKAEEKVFLGGHTSGIKARVLKQEIKADDIQDMGFIDINMIKVALKEKEIRVSLNGIQTSSSLITPRITGACVTTTSEQKGLTASSSLDKGLPIKRNEIDSRKLLGSILRGRHTLEKSSASALYFNEKIFTPGDLLCDLLSIRAPPAPSGKSSTKFSSSAIEAWLCPELILEIARRIGIDAQEVSRWKYPRLIEEFYRRLNRLDEALMPDDRVTMSYISQDSMLIFQLISIIQEVPGARRVLSVGIGNAPWEIAARQRGHTVIGIDLNSWSLRLVK